MWVWSDMFVRCEYLSRSLRVSRLDGFMQGSMCTAARPPASRSVNGDPVFSPLTPWHGAPRGCTVHRAGAGWRAARVLLAGGVTPCSLAAQARPGDRGVQDRGRSCGG